MNRICKYLPLLFCLSFAHAQSALDIGLGFGSFHDKASGSGIDQITGGTCVSGVACLQTPALSGFFMGFGGTIMLTKRYGFGGEAVLQPGKQDYAGLQSRQIFYDVNAVFAPVNQKKVVVRLEGGIGGATTNFYVTQNSCVGTAVCASQTQTLGSTKHFQVHTGVGVQIFLSEHLFIRPQFDLHYVPGFTNQFGSNLAPGAMIFVGYSMGDR